MDYPRYRKVKECGIQEFLCSLTYDMDELVDKRILLEGEEWQE